MSPIRSLLLACLIMNFNYTYSQLKPFESTITYKMLLIDSSIIGNNNKEIKICKSLMNKACNRIALKYSKKAISKAGYDEVADILSIVDNTFKEFNFLFKTDPNDIHYNVLSLAFRDTFPIISNAGVYQKETYNSKINESCRLIDCDEFCRIYMGIAQMVQLPLKMVHIPDHYYLRWYLDDGKYFCWDANDATLHQFDSTVNLYYRAVSYNSTYETNFFPKELNSDQVLLNYKILWADNIWEEKPIISIKNARKFYAEAISENYNSAAVYNNFVWLYIMHPELDRSIKLKYLHQYIDKAILLQKNLNYFDAKACLYALEDKFDLAISTEKKGFSLLKDYNNNKKLKAEKHLQCFYRHENCRTIK